LREKSGAICTSKPKPLLYERVTRHVTPTARSNPLTSSWQLPMQTKHMQDLTQGKIDRCALPFFTKLRVNQMFTPPHWRDFLEAAGHKAQSGPLLPCSGCDEGATPTPLHVLAHCPLAKAATIPYAATLTGKLANRGSGAWHKLDDLAERVQALLEAHKDLALGTSLLVAKGNKTVSPQGGQTTEDVLHNGVVFKHGLKPGGVLRDRDRASQVQTPRKAGKSKAKQRAPPADGMPVIQIRAPQGRAGTRQLVPHRAVDLWEAYNPEFRPGSTFTEELWELCDKAELATAAAADQWWASRPLLTSVLAKFCHVTVELFGAPLSLSEIPIRFSADANDGAFGF